MSTRVKGTIEYKDFGTGAWALVGNDGTTYELHKAPDNLQQEGLQVSVEGQIRDDVMTMAMIGPVLEVKNFKVIEG